MNFLPKINKINQNATARGRLDSSALAWLNEFNYQPRSNLKSSASSEASGSKTPQTQHKTNDNNNQPTNNYSAANNNNINQSFPSCSSFSSSFHSTFNINETIYLALTIGSGHAKYEVGIAVFDTNCPKLILSQISDCFQFKQTIVKIHLYSPTKIIIPNTLYNAFPVPQIILFIEKTFSGHIELIPFDRCFFCNIIGCDLLKKLGLRKSQNSTLNLFKKYYAVTAAAAIIKYLQTELKICLFENSLKISYESCKNSMVIDIQTAHSLELLYSIDSALNNKQKPSCLFEFLDNCVTAIGKRTLRARILQPSYDLVLITNRLNAIDELNKQMETMGALNDILKHFYSIDQCTQIAYNIKQEENIKMSEGLINQVLQLKKCLDKLPDLMKALSILNCTIFVDMRQLLQDSNFPFIANQINTIINCDLEFNGENKFFQRLHAIRPNMHSMLDLHHQIYSKALNDIRQYIVKLADDHQLPYRMMHSTTRGFHIQLQLKEFRSGNQVPRGMEVLFRGQSTILLADVGIKHFNYQINGIIKEITLVTYTIIANLFGNIRKEMDSIYNLMEIISELDIIVSLSKVSKAGIFCCPTFGDEMRIINGIHPFLYGKKSNKNPVPNSIIATPEFNFFLITGPNMSGKTVYLKTIAIIQIIAQIGAFVPATKAQFRLCDKLFTRLGFNDDIEQNYSSFWVEMHDMKYILDNITPNSLVIIDEFCRGTNPEEGLIIAKKICEKLISIAGSKLTTAVPNECVGSFFKLNEITAPFIYFATHFMELTKLQNFHLNVINLRLTATESYDTNGKLHLTYSHTIAEGVSTITGYGIALARTVRFPNEIIPIAEKLLKNQMSEYHGNINEHSLSNTSINNPINRYLSNSVIQITQQTTPIILNNYDDLISSLYNLYSNIMEDIRCSTNFKNFNIRTKQLMDEFLKENCSSSENIIRILKENKQFHQIIDHSKWFQKLNQRENIDVNDVQSNFPQTAILCENNPHDEISKNVSGKNVGTLSFYDKNMTETESLDETLSESSSFFEALGELINDPSIKSSHKMKVNENKETLLDTSNKRLKVKSDSFLGMKSDFIKDKSMYFTYEPQQHLSKVSMSGECSFVSSANTADSLLNFISNNRDDLPAIPNYESIDEPMNICEPNTTLLTPPDQYNISDDNIDLNLLLSPPDQFK